MERVDYESLIISDLLGYNSSGTLDLSPWYQRRSVWSRPQKSYLINTIFERKPVPSIYIRQSIDVENEKSIKEVVDGQQRIRSIVSYRSDEFAARHPKHIGPVKYSDLSKVEKGVFLSTPLSVGYLIGASDSDVIEIFGRINSVSKTLNPMEKLNALYSGEFKQFCLKEAAALLPFWRSSALFSATEIARMQEVQFLSDLVINLIQGLSDYSPATIKTYYKKHDESFPQEGAMRERLNGIFNKLVQLTPKDFTETVFRSAQISFSLMVVLDALRGPKAPSAAKVRSLMHDVDQKVIAAQEGKLSAAESARFIDGFAGGNLHRIRARKIRDEILRKGLS